jgi:hypothetical protein
MNFVDDLQALHVVGRNGVPLDRLPDSGVSVRRRATVHLPRHWRRRPLDVVRGCQSAEFVSSLPSGLTSAIY